MVSSDAPLRSAMGASASLSICVSELKPGFVGPFWHPSSFLRRRSFPQPSCRLWREREEVFAVTEP